MKMATKCTWTSSDSYDYDNCDYWSTDCGEQFTILEGTPEDNGMKYCCYCGKEINQKVEE